MKKFNYFILSGVLLMIFYNLLLNYRIIILKEGNRLEKELNIELNQIIDNNFLIIGEKLNFEDSFPFKVSIVFRFTDSCCFECVNEGLILLENVYKETLSEHLIISGPINTLNPYKKYPNFSTIKTLTELDKFNNPYVCFVNPEGFILFALILNPSNYETNRFILKNNCIPDISTGNLLSNDQI